MGRSRRCGHASSTRWGGNGAAQQLTARVMSCALALIRGDGRMRKSWTTAALGALTLGLFGVVAPRAEAAVDVSPNFQPHLDFSTGSSARSIALGDLNNDSHLDVVTGDLTVSKVSVLLGTGTGGFGPHVEYSLTSGPNDVEVADMNEDGKPDVVAATGSGVSVLVGDGAGHLSAGTTRVLPAA